MGIERLTFAEYQSAAGINFSSLKRIGKSPKHYRHGIASSFDATAPQAFGRLAHTMTLEPHLWGDGYVLQPESIKVRRGKAWDEFQASAAGLEIIKQADADAAKALADAVRGDKVAGPLVSAPGAIVEGSLFWERSGLVLKARPDLIVPGVTLADLKTTGEIDPLLWTRQAMRFDYLAQFAFYADAWTAVTGEALPFRAIVAESKDPHDVAVHRLTEGDLEYGRRIYESWLDTLIGCMERDHWPGVANDAEIQFARPNWATLDAENDVEGGYDWSAA